MGIYNKYVGEVVRRKVITTVRTAEGQEVDFTEGQPDNCLPGSEVEFYAANILGRTAVLADSLRVIATPGLAPVSLMEAVRCGEK